MYNLPKNEQEAQILMQQLKVTKPEDVLQSDIPNLLYVFDQTEYFGLRDKVAILLVDLESEELLELLIKKIKENFHTRYISTLIYCCGYYNCSEHIQLFIDIILFKNDMSFADAFGVINAMDSIDYIDCKYSINKIALFLSLTDAKHPRYSDIGDVKRYLEKYLHQLMDSDES